MNEEFQPQEAITADNIIVSPGVSSTIDALVWAICNEGDGVLVPQPFYNGFNVDIMNRCNVHVIGVSYEGIDGYSELADVFRPNINRKAIEAALRRAKHDGITVRALLISQSVISHHLPGKTHEQGWLT